MLWTILSIIDSEQVIHEALKAGIYFVADDHEIVRRGICFLIMSHWPGNLR